VVRPALAGTVRVRAEQVLLRSDQPRLNIELQTDSIW